MKKLLLALGAVICMATASFAQDKKAEKTKHAVKTTAATAPAKTKTVAPAKKDGTPDMRYKANKEAVKAKPAGPAKKDGTPDMRYKANKDAKKKA